MTLPLELILSSLSLDTNVSLATVFATYHSTDGSPMSGSITFTPAPHIMLNSSAGIIYYNAPIIAVLDNTGSFTTQLIATDDPDINPSNWTWTVSESMSHNNTPYTNTYSIKAPADSIINLADEIPVPDYTGTPIVRGRPGSTGVVDVVDL